MERIKEVCESIEKRYCDVCHKNDLPSQVCCSNLGGMSFNYCSICGILGAEPIVGEGYPSYNSNDDKYYDESDNHIVITLKSGAIFNTRTEYVTWRNTALISNERQ